MQVIDDETMEELLLIVKSYRIFARHHRGMRTRLQESGVLLRQLAALIQQETAAFHVLAAHEARLLALEHPRGRAPRGKALQGKLPAALVPVGRVRKNEHVDDRRRAG